jgi:hypothetical protein
MVLIHHWRVGNPGGFDNKFSTWRQAFDNNAAWFSLWETWGEQRYLYVF